MHRALKKDLPVFEFRSIHLYKQLSKKIDYLTSDVANPVDSSVYCLMELFATTSFSFTLNQMIGRL